MKRRKDPGQRFGVRESGRDRKALAADAGLSQVSAASVAAGVGAAYGAFVVLAGLAAAALDALEVGTDVLTASYEDLDVADALLLGGLLLLSHLFGGYVAGRTARRSGVLHGLLVAVVGLAVAGGVAALVRTSDTDTVITGLRTVGVPTSVDEYQEAGNLAGLASLVGILVGSLLGGLLGERWHGRLLARAVDPRVGTEAEARQRAEADLARAADAHTRSRERALTANPALAAHETRESGEPAGQPRPEGATTAAPVAGAGRDRNGRVSHNRASTERVVTGETVRQERDDDPRARRDAAVLADARREQLVADDRKEGDRHRRFLRRHHRGDH